MDGKVVDVVDINEHLGLAVSGEREEELNVNNRIAKGRGIIVWIVGTCILETSQLQEDGAGRIYLTERRQLDQSPHLHTSPKGTPA